MIGFERKRVRERGKRFFMPRQIRQSPAAMEKELRRPAVDFGGFREEMLRLLVAPVLKLDRAELCQRLEMFWIGTQDLAIETGGFGQVAGLVRAPRVLNEMLAHAGRGP